MQPSSYLQSITALGAVCALSVCGCAVVTHEGPNSRDYYIIGFARVRVLETEGTLPKPVAFEITGVGLSVGQVTQLGYFRDFEVHLRPDSNSAVIIVRSKSDLDNLKRVMAELQQQQLCTITRS